MLFVGILLGPSVMSLACGDITILGPSPDVQVEDSPYDMSGLGKSFFLEELKDGTNDFPPGAILIPGNMHGAAPGTDSVDGDDNVIDGFGNLAMHLPYILVGRLVDSSILVHSLPILF